MSYLAQLFTAELPPELAASSAMSAAAGKDKSKAKGQGGGSADTGADGAARNSPDQQAAKANAGKKGNGELVEGGKRYIEFDMKIEKQTYDGESIAPQHMNDDEFLKRWSLHRAARKGNIEAMDRLLAMFRTYPRWAATPDEDGSTALHRAAEAEEDAAGAAAIKRLAGVEGVDADAASGEAHNWRPVHRAVISNNPKCVRALLADHNASPDAVDISKLSPLHYCAKLGRVDCARELIQHSANLLAQDPFKRTALHIAAMHSQLDVIELLVQARAEKEARDYEMMTPLLLAASQGRADSVAVLYDLGAEVEARDYCTGTALLLACENAAFNVDKPKEELKYLEVVRVLIEHCRANVEAETRDTQMRPIHIAARYGNLRLLEYLIGAGRAFADSRTGDLGRNILHIVCSVPVLRTVRGDTKALRRYEDMSRWIVANGAVDLYSFDKNGQTAEEIGDGKKAYQVSNCIPQRSKEDENALDEELEQGIVK